MFGRNKNKQNGSGNKSGVRVNPFGNPGHTDKGKQGGQDDDDGKPKPPPTVTPPDTNAQMMQFMKDQGLFEGIDMGKFSEAVRNGNADDATAIFTNAMANAVRVAVIGAQRISNTAVQRAIEEATNNATGRTTRELGLRELRTNLPFAVAPETAPLVEGIYDQFLDNGVNPVEAVSQTMKYFEEQAKLMGKHFGMVEKQTDNTQLGGRGFGNTPSSFSTQNNIDGTGDDDDVYDFVAALTSGQQTFEDINRPVQDVRVVNDGNQGDGNQGAGGSQGNQNAA